MCSLSLKLCKFSAVLVWKLWSCLSNPQQRQHTHTGRVTQYLVRSPSVQKVYSQYRDSEKHTTAAMTDMAVTK